MKKYLERNSRYILSLEQGQKWGAPSANQTLYQLFVTITPLEAPRRKKKSWKEKGIEIERWNSKNKEKR